MTCFMKQGVNRSNTKIALDEKFARDQIFMEHDAYSPNIVFSFLAIFALC